MRQNTRKSKRIKTLLELAGVGYHRKDSTQEYAAKYWGTYGAAARSKQDGKGNDKTYGFHSRPGKKESIRNSNRALKKRARAILKRKMIDEVLETS